MKKYTILSIVALIVFLGVNQVTSAQGNPFYGTNDFVGGGQKGTGGNTGNTKPAGTGKNTGNTNNPGTGSNTGNTTTNTSSSQAPEKLDDPLGDSVSIEGLLLRLFEIIIYIGIPIVAFFLIWSGFMFITAQGNPEKIETAKSRLLYTIIGAILLLGAWTISQAIKGTVEDIKRGGTALFQKDNEAHLSIIPDLIRNPDTLI